jgi:hypothetical protein
MTLTTSSAFLIANDEEDSGFLGPVADAMVAVPEDINLILITGLIVEVIIVVFGA